jgi:PAS domain S-box-containing protein
MGMQPQPEGAYPPQPPSARNLIRTAILLGALALLVSFGLAYFSYLASRSASLDSLYQSRLRLARTLAADYALEVSEQRFAPLDPLNELNRLWKASERRFRGGYLCVIQPDGRLALNTADECRAGDYVGDVRLEDRQEGEAATVAELVAAGGDWVGATTGPNGEARLSAYAYSEQLKGLVAVHVPAAEVEGEIRTAALPWAAGLATMTLLGFVATLGLLQRAHARAAAELTRRAQQQAAVAELGQQALAGIPLPALLDKAAATLAKTLRVEYSLALELSPGGETLLLRAGVGWRTGLVGQATVEASPSSPAGQALLSPWPVIVEELSSDLRLRELPLLRQHGVRSGLSVTIAGQPQPHGVLGAYSAKQRRFSLDDINFLLAVAHVLATAIESRRANEALWEQQRTLSTLMSNLPGMVCRCRHDREWTMEFVSEGALALTGYAPADLINNRTVSYNSLIHPEDQETVWRQVEAAVRESRPFQLTYRLRTRAGEEKWVWEQGRGIRTAAGEPLPVLEGFVTDITEQRRLEQQLHQAAKLEAVGLLAGGVAHDFNNVLMVVKGYSELLLDRLDKEDRLHSMVEEINKAANRAALLVGQLMAFGRRQVLQAQVLDLNGVVEDMKTLLERLLGEDIELATRLHPEPSRVRADPGQIQQVIMNLAVNARDAMPQGGRLTLETDVVELDESYARNHVGVRPGSYLMLAVSDTGHGMDKQTQARIFEPFFTTKEKGRGTGLGLATIYGIVKQSGGNIWVYSEPAQGTTFKIYLPQVEEEKEAAAVEGEIPVRVSGRREGQTVLVAEDEASLRGLMREFLETLGYTVLEAGSGAEAVGLAEQHPGPITLLMTDVVMPGMSARALAEQVAARRPEIKVLYVSGYTDNAIVHHGVLEADMMFLQKPFTLEALERKLEEILGPDQPERA